MPTPKTTDEPTAMQLADLERLGRAMQERIIVHPATINYRRMLGLCKRKWISYESASARGAPLRRGTVLGDVPCVRLTERGQHIVIAYSSDQRLVRALSSMSRRMFSP